MNKVYIIIVSFFLVGCSTVSNFFEDNKYFYKHGYQRVQLDSEDQNVKNIHPIKISPEKVEGALKLILTSYGTKSQQLFSKSKITDYSIAISEALKEAESNEDVVFTVEGWYKQKGMSSNRVTSGRIFYNKSGLNLIFGSILRKGNMQETDPMLASGINPDLKQNPFAPGSRFQSVKNKFRLSALPNSGVFRPASAGKRKDWLVFTRKALKARSFLNKEEQTTALRSNIQVEGLREEVDNLKRELRTMRGGPNNARYGYGYSYPPAYPNSYPPVYRQQTPYDMNNQNPYARYPNQYPGGYYPPSKDAIANPNQYQNPNQVSLKSLESMRERGLISEENYLKKLKELGY